MASYRFVDKPTVPGLDISMFQHGLRGLSAQTLHTQHNYCFREQNGTIIAVSNRSLVHCHGESPSVPWSVHAYHVALHIGGVPCC